MKALADKVAVVTGASRGIGRALCLKLAAAGVRVTEVRPGLATVTIVNVVPWWNDFFFPLLFIQSETWKTIPLGMQLFFGQHMTNWALVFAGMILASLPLLVLYLLMSRQFIAGLTSGAVKG